MLIITHINKNKYKDAVQGKIYPIPEVHKETVTQYINELENDGIIRRAPTQYINPLVVVIKKNGQIRLCLDARELNKRMANNHAQPLSIKEVFQHIGHRKYFTTLDVTQAFWQIPLEEESQKYIGFMYNNQTYVFRRLPFSLKMSGSSFSRAMNLALNEQDLDFLIIYLDMISLLPPIR